MLLFLVISMHCLCVHLHIHTYRLTAMWSAIVLKLKFNYNNHAKLAHASNWGIVEECAFPLTLILLSSFMHSFTCTHTFLDVQAVTFQVVLATDSERSFILLLYSDIRWDISRGQRALVGFNSGRYLWWRHIVHAC